ncbi:hypothetical protein PMZ80_001978 [Knufia obscura]|uniref:Major facilitator superfamily (MFS) profile domain-containing protein n=1 Tax=Knufia obscura TaxID=1635080 RepID=A0ABR0RX20_9EURO|nr:hypothetical protein PMZ80_001978 [Knufia obscura]
MTTPPKHAREGSEQIEAQYSGDDHESLFKEDLPPPVAESEPKMTLWQALRKWPRVSWYTLALTSTILLWGFDNVLVGSVAAMPEFQKVYGIVDPDIEGGYIIPTNWLSIWNALGSVSAMLGALLAGWLGDKIGRRWMLASATVLSASAVVIFIVSDRGTSIDQRCGLFFVGKVLNGLGIGSITTTSQVYLSETVPQQLRASILPAFPVFQLLGSVIIQVMMGVKGPNSYRISFATMWAFSIVPLIASLIIPESPTWLLRKGKTSAAAKAHARLEANKKFPGAHLASFSRLQSTIAKSENQETKFGYLACFQGTNLRRTGIVVFANILPEMFGLSMMGSASYYLQRVGVTPTTANLFMIIGIAIGLFANISTFWILSRFGRRKLILVTLVPAVLMWFSIGVAGTIQREGTFIYWYVPVTMMVIIATVGLGVWPASYVVASETSTLRLRAKTSGVGWFVSGGVSASFGALFPIFYNTDALNLRAQTGYPVGGFAALSLVLAFFFVPEMKDRSAAEIDRMFELKIPARQFKNWEAGSDNVPLVKRSGPGMGRRWFGKGYQRLGGKATGGS